MRDDVPTKENDCPAKESKKEESVCSNQGMEKEENPFEYEGYRFRRLVPAQEERALWQQEEEWFEPRGEDSLHYYYSEEEVNEILRRRAGGRKTMKKGHRLNRGR